MAVARARTDLSGHSLPNHKGHIPPNNHQFTKEAGIHFSATIESSSSSEQPGCKRKRFDGRGDCEPPSQRSCRIGGTNPRVLFPYLFRPQTRWRLASSYQPQVTVSVPQFKMENLMS